MDLDSVEITHADLLERFEREHRQRRYWAMFFLARLRHAEITYLSNRQQEDRIAVIVPQDKKWRMSLYCPDGPLSHYVFRDDEADRECYWHWVIDPSAAVRLEEWTRTEKWADGLLRIEYIQIWQTLYDTFGYNTAASFHRAVITDGLTRATLDFGWLLLKGYGR